MFSVAKGCRIYPETPHVILSHTQELSRNLEMLWSRPYNWALSQLYWDHQESTDLEDRVFTSLDWYLRSCRAPITEAEAIVNLAIGLESLLQVGPGEGVRERVRNAILTLLGPVERLESWVHQFYTARSDSVHEGEPGETMFYPQEEHLKKKRKEDQNAKKKDDQKIITHRPLMAYGRRIFRMCVASILAGAMQARMNHLEDLFRTNAERVDLIQHGLEHEKTDTKRLLSVALYVHQLNDYGGDLMDPDDVKIADVWRTVKLALQTFKGAVTTTTDTVEKAIETITSYDGVATVALLDDMKACAAALRAFKPTPIPGDTVSEMTWIMIAFLDYASGSSFRLACYIRENPRSVLNT